MVLSFFKKITYSVDWLLFGAMFFISIAGLLTMNSFVDEGNFFSRQAIWITIASFILIISSLVDWRFLRKTGSVTLIYLISAFSLILLFILGSVFKGAQSWYNLGLFAIQPVEFTKIVVLIILAKYFSRRHIEIANIRHIIVSGFYIFILFLLVFFQPDFGSAVIIFSLWFFMILFSGVSKKHLIFVLLSGTLAFTFLWFFVFQDYQRDRIVSFLHPLADLSGAGYNAHQSMIAVGSGEMFGKGVGMGSQSKLKFLPEYETDFIFAAFSEEWGFVGVVIIFGLYGVVFWRIFSISKKGSSNFEILYGLGLASLFMVHGFIHVGMNIGLLPVTGITMPFMSYGGSHLIAEFLGVGILMGQRQYAGAAHREVSKNEIIGAV
jgi:rod shape determining protein RodA